MNSRGTNDDGERVIDRRSLIRSGVIVAGSLALGGVGIATAGDADPRDEEQEGLIPNENVGKNSVNPFPGTPDRFHEVETGNWIEHSFGFASSDCERVNNIVLDFLKSTVHIAGERIDQPDQYWQSCQPFGDLTAVFWEYNTPPKPPGTYEFSLTIEVTEAFGRFPEGFTRTVSAPYDVVPRRG